MSSLMSLVKGMPEALHKQYNYEVSHVTGGAQLLHSSFLQVHPPIRTYNMHACMYCT